MFSSHGGHLTNAMYHHGETRLKPYWPKIKTLHFICFNACFVNIYFVVRLTHDYDDFIADDNYAVGSVHASQHQTTNVYFHFDNNTSTA